ncbi:hypothetical protein [Aequorivita echinoideorum]|uniref:Uncharacterized protein n=1 Tax=Aequorivita echinoideorum TaxID=1549647 RepID=A0ABS5S205_9FLAO|nr:hypothetical protein [Aequorivita echinoideorum]MBT0607236.1 hypothetical protein [Aequorivita echinoideorum]
MKFLFPLFLCLFLLYSCRNNSQQTLPEDTSPDFSIVFGEKNFSLPQLSAPAREEMLKWGGLEDLLAEANNVNGSNFEALKNRSERLQEYADSVIKMIPDTLNTNFIQSRLKVIKTRTSLLYQVAHESRIDSAQVQNSILEFNTSVENFVIQLNEKFRKQMIDYERREDEENELKKQKQFSDSIYRLELQDNKNR